MRRTILLLAFLLCGCIQAPVSRGNLYLPFVDGGVLNPCAGTSNTAPLAFLFRSDPLQQRKHIQCNPHLMKAAQARADDMAQRNYFNHTDPDHIQPNAHAAANGCILPDWYPADGNSIESIGLNYESALDTWEAWKRSPAHAAHVLGEIEFWSAQSDYGIGYAENAESRYWVIMTAPPC